MARAHPKFTPLNPEHGRLWPREPTPPPPPPAGAAIMGLPGWAVIPQNPLERALYRVDWGFYIRPVIAHPGRGPSSEPNCPYDAACVGSNKTIQAFNKPIYVPPKAHLCCWRKFFGSSGRLLIRMVAESATRPCGLETFMCATWATDMHVPWLSGLGPPRLLRPRERARECLQIQRIAKGPF